MTAIHAVKRVISLGLHISEIIFAVSKGFERRHFMIFYRCVIVFYWAYF